MWKVKIEPLPPLLIGDEIRNWEHLHQCQKLKTFIGLFHANKASHFGRGGTACRDGEGIFSGKFTKKFNFVTQNPLTATRNSPGGQYHLVKIL